MMDAKQRGADTHAGRRVRFALVCALCGCDEVQVMAWVEANTGKVHDDCHSWNYEDANWCPQCEDHALIITAQEFSDITAQGFSDAQQVEVKDDE